MDPNLPRPQPLAWLMRANVVALISLGLTIAGSCISAVVVGSNWITTLTNHITYVEHQENENGVRIVKLESNIVSLDKRANDLQAEIIRLHSLSEASDAVLRARVDVLDERTRFLAGGSYQPQPGHGR